MKPVTAHRHQQKHTHTNIFQGKEQRSHNNNPIKPNTGAARGLLFRIESRRLIKCRQKLVARTERERETVPEQSRGTQLEKCYVAVPHCFDSDNIPFELVKPLARDRIELERRESDLCATLPGRGVVCWCLEFNQCSPTGKSIVRDGLQQRLG